MNHAKMKVILTTLGAILFNIVFWNEKLALNAVLFDAFIITALLVLYPGSISKPTVKWLLLAHIVAVCTVLLHNTFLSKLAFSTTLLLLVVFVQYLHRSLWYAGGSAIMNYILMLPNFWHNIQDLRTVNPQQSSRGKTVRLLVIPILLLTLFILLYSAANSVFSHIVGNIGDAISNFFSHLFDFVTLERLWFLILGLFITGGLLLKAKQSYFSTTDSRQNDELTRQKNDLAKWRSTNRYELVSLILGKFANGVLALRNEHTTGIISLLLLNTLLLFINAIDVIYVWFGKSYTGVVDHAAAVHEGAGLLIFSIVLAMLLLLFFFRGNLNFYKKNQWLKYGAYLWIAQNLVLVISVLIRDYYYIMHNGLAYKRIGVLFFLLMVLAGLITVFIKIRFQKTNYYLLKVNAWCALSVMVLASCIHWDETIASYNIARKSSLPLDVKFLLTLSDKTLPIIEKNIDIFDDKQLFSEDSEAEYIQRTQLSFKQIFENRKQQFFEKQKGYSWLSWNNADAYVKQQLPPTQLSLNSSTAK